MVKLNGNLVLYSHFNRLDCRLVDRLKSFPYYLSHFHISDLVSYLQQNMNAGRIVENRKRTKNIQLRRDVGLYFFFVIRIVYNYWMRLYRLMEPKVEHKIERWVIIYDLIWGYSVGEMINWLPYANFHAETLFVSLHIQSGCFFVS